MIGPGHLKILFPIVILLASCSAPAQPVIPTAKQAPSPTPVPTEIPTETVQPTATNIPGYEDWSVFNPQAVDIAIENESLILTLKFRALWFMNQRGVLFHKPVSGDFKITANVYAEKSSDP